MIKTTIQAKLPPELVNRAEAFVREGWANDLDELLTEALRRYLELHSSELTEAFLRDDVDWGLHGSN